MIRSHLADLQTYEPVDPPEVLAQQAGIPEDEIIKLNGNENPYGPSPMAVEAVAKAPLHVYPDPLQRRMRAALGRSAMKSTNAETAASTRSPSGPGRSSTCSTGP